MMCSRGLRVDRLISFMYTYDIKYFVEKIFSLGNAYK